MAISGISAISNALTQMSQLAPISPIGTPAAGAGAGAGKAAGASGFADLLTGMLDDVQASQAKADTVSEAAAVGKADPIEVLTATTEAQLTVQMATVVRNRAVEAFNEIMRMQV
jgi:flagellar hook-basal body complex protein FliE